MVPLPDFNQLLQMLTVNAELGPPQFAVIAVTIFVVKWMKANPNIPTPKKVRPYLYFAVGLVSNVTLEFVLGTLALKPLVAEQLLIWFTTLGLRHIIDAPKASDPQPNADPRDGRFGDPRRP